MEDHMKLNIENITEASKYWQEVNTLAGEAFPPEEYLAPIELVRMATGGNLNFSALLDQDTFVGFMVTMQYENMVYLFFLAIAPSYRSKGYGSRAIETLKAQYPGKTQVVDFEALDDSADNAAQRKKRRQFYLKNGYCETGLFVTYYGVTYEVFCTDEQFDVATFKALMKTVPIEGFVPTYSMRQSASSFLNSAPQ